MESWPLWWKIEETEVRKHIAVEGEENTTVVGYPTLQLRLQLQRLPGWNIRLMQTVFVGELYYARVA